VCSSDLQPGERVAVTGESGSGKSTLVHAVAGLLDTTAGEVLVGGRRTGGAGVDAPERRSSDVLLVPSAPHLFGGSIAANLRLAAPDATDRDLHRALAAVGLEDWVAALPDGLEARLGDGGVTASGGQRQRLGLARAYLSPASVVLLDEPASHLPEDDAIAALRAVLAARPGRAAIVVSHRASERRIASREVRLYGGRATDAPRDRANWSSMTLRR
jgi:ABC-type bacteriocin/lantibiotic exporter with double-glycine peptidase domain